MRLHALSLEGRWDDMTKLIPDADGGRVRDDRAPGRARRCAAREVGRTPHDSEPSDGPPARNRRRAPAASAGSWRPCSRPRRQAPARCRRAHHTVRARSARNPQLPQHGVRVGTQRSCASRAQLRARGASTGARSPSATTSKPLPTRRTCAAPGFSPKPRTCAVTSRSARSSSCSPAAPPRGPGGDAPRADP